MMHTKKSLAAGLDRRTFLLSGLTAGTVAGAAAPRLDTLSDWLRARPEEREAGVRTCLERIQKDDASLQAWVQVRAEKPSGTGSLLGIPFGAKDVIETRGLATEYGSPLYKGRVGTTDAAIVTRLRKRGAILLGKTQTAAFAMRDPPPTRNPRNLAHTPGGSSSGSAAAVAAGMVPFALGTQTGGSTIRPASFCGITGFKPTFGLLPVEGVLPYAKSLDTIGLFTPVPADMLLLWEALGYPAGRPQEFVLGIPEPMPEVEPEMATAFQSALALIRRANIVVQPVKIGALLGEIINAQTTIKLYEGARVHRKRFEQYGDRLGHTAAVVREGLQIPQARFTEALRFVADCRRSMAEVYQRTPIVALPAAPGAAPRGLSSTGNDRLNIPWTALGTPAISIPMPVEGLPLGLQLTANRGEDARVLQAAARLQEVLQGKP